MMKRESLKDYLKRVWNMTLEEYENLEDEVLIEKILNGYDRIKSYPDKK